MGMEDGANDPGYNAKTNAPVPTPKTLDHYSTHKAAAVAQGATDHSAHFGVLSSDAKVPSPLPTARMGESNVSTPAFMTGKTDLSPKGAALFPKK